MTTLELYGKISEAYSTQNLNKITVTLLRLYKEKQVDSLRQIAEMINESTPITIDNEGRFFSKLMMLYHPDRGDFHRHEIEKLRNADDYNGLLGYCHILKLQRIEEIAATLSSIEDIDYSPVYEWDVNLEGFTIIDTKGPVITRHRYKPERGYSFYEGLKLRMYGKTSMSLPTYYLEDLDEFELSRSNIDDLDGIQYCRHAIVMDLSENEIRDISLLWCLTQLEELNLSENRIEEIESLVNLRNLKTLKISHNAVRDVSCLFQLPQLEYVDLTGNKIPSSQINELEELGITVLT